MSTLPSGAAWYKVEIWLINSNTMIWRDVFFDSTGWGNYRKSETEEGVLKKAGSEEQYSKNNIYDLAGNVWEWTMEANFTNSRTVRGGDCSYDGESYPVSARFSFKPTYTGEKLENIGSRMILY